MTPPEIEALVARLTRIWEIPIHSTEEMPLFGGIFPGIILEVHVIASGLFFKMWRAGTRDEDCFQLRAWSTGTMHIGNLVGCAPHVEGFRRNCWLSGCAIEASAHEKAEWIRDFSREEVESWNLNF